MRTFSLTAPESAAVAEALQGLLDRIAQADRNPRMTAPRVPISPGHLRALAATFLEGSTP